MIMLLTTIAVLILLIEGGLYVYMKWEERCNEKKIVEHYKNQEQPK